jgi:hypothetical protein
MDNLKEILEHISIRLLSLINGKLLGDGSLTIEGTKQPRFRFQHRYEDKEWCYFCYKSLNNCITINSPKYKKDEDSRLKAGFSESVYVQSKTSPVFTLLKSFWYEGKKKILPLEMLEHTLNAESLAWWYQDDGHLVSKNGVVKKIILSTDNFSLEENKGLIKLLKTLFHIKFSIDGQNRLCLYDQPQIMYFLYLVKDYIHPAMSRKLPTFILSNQANYSLQKRKTIYLPYKLITPTREMRYILSTLVPEIFVNDWFTHIFVANRNTSTIRFSYQVTLQGDELMKIGKVQQYTGLRLSDIISILFSLNGKEVCPMDKPLNLKINEEVEELPAAVD